MLINQDYKITAIEELSDRLVSFVQNIISKAEIKDGTPYIKVVQTELAQMSGLAAKTVSRRLKELKDLNFIDFAAKKGNSGGTVVTINPNKVQFIVKDNPVTNVDHPRAGDFVKDLFPKPEPPTPKFKRRSPAEVAREKVLQNRKRSMNEQLNEEMIDQFGARKSLSYDFFMKQEDGLKKYQTYLLSKMYNEFAFAYEMHAFNQGWLKGEPTYHDCLPTKFYGTHQFTSLYNLNTYLLDNDISARDFVGSHFNRALLFMENQKATNARPRLNAFQTEYGLWVYETYKDYCKKAYKPSRYGLLDAGTVVVPVFGSEALKSVLAAYRNATQKYDHYSSTVGRLFETYIEEKADQDIQSVQLIHKDIMKNMKDYSEEDKRMMNLFIAESVLISYKRDTIRVFPSIIAQPLHHAKLMRIFGDMRKAYAASNPSMDQEKTAQVHANLAMIVYSKHGNYGVDEIADKVYLNYMKAYLNPKSQLQEVMQLDLQHRGIYLDIEQLRDLLNRYNNANPNNVIPLDIDGLLDLAQIES